METLYLSRRNLLTLLSKLDRRAAGDETACTIVKYQNPTDPFVNSINGCLIVAVEDKDFYANRSPGQVHPSDDPGTKICKP